LRQLAMYALVALLSCAFAFAQPNDQRGFGETKLPPFGVIDGPAEDVIVARRTVVTGWALDLQDAPVGVELLIDGRPTSNTARRTDRGDVCAQYAYLTHCVGRQPGFAFAWDTATERDGIHTISARLIDANGNVAIVGARAVTVRNAGTGAVQSLVPSAAVASGAVIAGPPLGSVDTPVEGTTAAGEVAVTGWAVDDSGIAAVKVYRSPVGSEVTQANGLVFIGDANFVPSARQDIEARYQGYPFVVDAGWGLMVLTRMLPNQGDGVYTLWVYAQSRAGETQLIGTRQFTGANSTSTRPFGTIDTPAQGSLVTGVMTNFGWVLAPQPNALPTDGSTIDVYIDGVFRGHPVYNNFRSDIAAQLPAFRNSNGAVGYFHFDTATLLNGIHSIEWVARDDAGNDAGLGSRWFTVVNGPALTVTLTPALAVLQSCSAGVGTYLVSTTVTVHAANGPNAGGVLTDAGGTFTSGSRTQNFFGPLAPQFSANPNSTQTIQYSQLLTASAAEANSISWRVTVRGGIISPFWLFPNIVVVPFEGSSVPVPVTLPAICP
jgi:hypothetical protein